MRNFKFLMVVPMLLLAFSGFSHDPAGHEKAGAPSHPAGEVKTAPAEHKEEAARGKTEHKKKKPAPEKKK